MPVSHQRLPNLRSMQQHSCIITFDALTQRIIPVSGSKFTPFYPTKGNW
jgi:hypothetical protein